MRSFTISTDRIGRRRWCHVRVHDDLSALRRAAHALRPHRDGVGHWEACYGCFHPTCYRVNETTGAIRYPANGYAGTLRIVERDHLVDEDGCELPFTEIVAHELVHAAATIYRMNVARTINLGAGRSRSFEHEEEFAYIYGELFADLASKLT